MQHSEGKAMGMTSFDEALRALEKNWRSLATDIRQAGGGGCSNAKATERERCADELAPLIAELGQEVGAVASRPLHKVEPSDDEPQFRTLSNEVAPQVYFYRLGWNQCRDAMLLTSPAQTSEARDAVVGEVVEIGDDDEGQPRILIHTTREAIKNGPPLAFRTVSVAAMRQEGGNG